ncbi:ermin [Microcaecilia unicolor]|uniref:Ermin n=1 Tax=Microcaecilia unicolor TaxID=1415580 RepID=A0A6P7YL24_9AMPH|nr:ermin [Microcaecilia unicolor]
MSDEAITSTSMPEYNENTPSEDTQVPIIDKPIGMVRFENIKLGSEDTFVQENQAENKKIAHDISKSRSSIQLLNEDMKTEEKQVENSSLMEEGRNSMSSHESRINEMAARKGESDTETPVDSSENEITCQDQMAAEGTKEETYNSLRKIKEVEELVDSGEKTQDELQTAKIMEELEMKMVDQNMQLIKDQGKNEKELYSSRQENSPQCPPFVGSSTQVLPGSGNKPDISRHSYSRYDTVSYQKIRKGNTKQRVDEFESMNL